MTERIADLRSRQVSDALQRVRQLTADGSPDRDRLERVLDEVKSLAAQPELWSEQDFPAPDEGERQARYLISETPDHHYALYLNVMRPGKRIPPHNHTTWACIAGVDGVEQNFLYRRTDDATVPGRATLEESAVVAVGPGSGIALLPDDIHAVQIDGTRTIRHLHLYGKALETLTERVSYDLDAQTCQPMALGVRTRR